MRVYMREAAKRTLETRVPARLDRLPWGRFHTLVAVALGITWILDGLEVTLAGSIAGALEASPRLHFTASDIGLASSFYLAGGVIGALGFGWMTDRLGRRLLFFITLGLYLVSTAATAFAWNLESFCLFPWIKRPKQKKSSRKSKADSECTVRAFQMRRSRQCGCARVLTRHLAKSSKRYDFRTRTFSGLLSWEHKRSFITQFSSPMLSF